MFTSYQHVMAHLDGLGMFHMDLTLERMHTALSRLGLQHPPFAVVQVVGTNGKGSTSTFLASVAKAHGLRTGLYTSPHFVFPEERIRIDGLPLSRDIWPRLGNAVMKAEPNLTYFEFLTVLAVLAFAESGVELAVMEAGLGGRWDATTAVHADLLCVAPIAMDHEAVLGATLHAIAADKADALRNGEPLITGPQEADALHALEAAAHARHTSLCMAATLAPLPDAAQLGLCGPHQRHNAQLALGAWRELARQRGWGSDAQKEAQGLRDAFLPGRFQRCPADHGLPPLLLDGAHNPHGMRALRRAVDSAGITPSAVIFSCLADKDMASLLPDLRAIAGTAPVFTPTIQHNQRAALSTFIAAQYGPTARPASDLPAALRMATALRMAAEAGARQGDGPLLICGSLYLLGEFFTLYPEYLISTGHGEVA